MFIPNAVCSLVSPKGFNVYGKPDYAPKRVVACALVRMKLRDENTPVRTDSSASRAFAKEPVAQVIIMVAHTAEVKQKDKLEFLGRSFEVTGVHPRFDVHGRPDHTEVEAAAWQG